MNNKNYVMKIHFLKIKFKMLMYVISIFSNQILDECTFPCIFYKLIPCYLPVIVLINGLQNFLNTGQQHFFLSLNKKLQREVLQFWSKY